MSGNPRQGFVLSILLHLAVVAAVVFFTFFKPPEEPPRTVFELVAAPAPSAEIKPADAAVEFSMPAVRPPPPRPRPEVVPQPEPPRPQPVVPVPQLAPQKPPEPKPVAKPEPPPPTVSYEEFLKQHGAPRATTPRPPPKPVAVPRINTTFSPVIRDVVINYERLGELSDAEQSALDRYIARLKEALRRAWDKPTELAQSLSTTVEFDVAATGRLSNVRVTRASGSAPFDRSVTGAFSTLGSAGATPDGRSHQLRLTFRMTDE